jgi:hypothetical protein
MMRKSFIDNEEAILKGNSFALTDKSKYKQMDDIISICE